MEEGQSKVIQILPKSLMADREHGRVKVGRQWGPDASQTCTLTDRGGVGLHVLTEDSLRHLQELRTSLYQGADLEAYNLVTLGFRPEIGVPKQSSPEPPRLGFRPEIGVPKQSSPEPPRLGFRPEIGVPKL